MPRIVRFHQTGGPEVLQLDDLPVPDAGPGEVVIQVHAIGLNRAEAMFRAGAYPQYAPELPSALGYEASGIVHTVGDGVTRVRVGDAVSVVPSFRMGRYFTCGEYARVPEHAAAAFPSRLTWVEAAAIWMPYMTAYGGLVEYGRLAAGEHVVITAASSSVGVAAIQIANAVGAIPIAVTRGEAKRAFVEAQGARHVIVSDGENTADRILELTAGRGAPMVFDPVAGSGIVELARATAYHGRLFVYGRLSAEPALFPVNHGLAKGLTVRGYSMFEVVNFPEVFARARVAVFRGLETGDYQPAIDSTFGLDDIVRAHRHMESGRQTGKIVVVR